MEYVDLNDDAILLKDVEECHTTYVVCGFKLCNRGYKHGRKQSYFVRSMWI